MPFMMTKGFSVPEMGPSVKRAQVISRQVGESPHIFLVLFGFHVFHEVWAEHRKALEFAEQCLYIADSVQKPELLVGDAWIASSLTRLGEFVRAREHVVHVFDLYGPDQHQDLGLRYGIDLNLNCRMI